MAQPKPPKKQTQDSKPIRAYARLIVTGPDGEMLLKDYLKERGDQVVGMTIGGKFYPRKKK